MVSIIITAYNAQNYLEKAVNSALNQTYNDIEIVIVEDCSTDSTLEICRRLANSHDNIVLIEHDVNRGAGAARHTGINASKGDFILTLDADDWLEKDYIEKLVNVANKTGAEIVSGGIIVEKPNNFRQVTYYGERVLEGIDKVKFHFNEEIIFMNNKIVSRRLCELHPYCTRRYVEDTQTIVPMLYLANKVVYCDVAGYHYWMNPKSLTHQADDIKNALYKFLCGIDLIEYFADKEPEYQQLFNASICMKFLPVIKQATFEQLNQYPEANAELGYKLMKIINFNNN